MLQITIPKAEWYDESRQEFIYTDETTIQLEHSLISLSKWESKWKKPYLDFRTQRTQEEFIDYVRCMTLTKNVNPLVYEAIDQPIADTIQAYINDKLTATWFSEEQKKRMPSRNRIVTSELIYYWMIAQNIPVEFQKWHLSRLLTLIEVCNAENSPKKMSSAEIARQNRELNAKRRAERGTHG